MMSSRLDAGTESYFEAAALGEIHSLKEIVQNGNKNVLLRQDPEGRTLFHHAVSHDQREVVEFLMSQGVPIDFQDKEGKNVLHLAVSLGNYEMILYINYLLDLYGDVEKNGNQPDSMISFQPLGETSDAIPSNLFSSILPSFSLNSPASSHEIDRTQAIGTFRPTEKMKELLMQQERNEGFTPLHLACRMNDPKCAIVLAKMGSSSSSSFLDVFSFQSNSVKEEILNATDYYQRTPLSIAIEKRSSPFLIVYLVQRGCKLRGELPLPPLQASVLPPSSSSSSSSFSSHGFSSGTLFKDLASSTFGHQSHFSLTPLSEMKKLFNDEKSGDVVFIIEEKMIYGHSDIVISRCEYLAEKMKKEEANKPEQARRIRIRLASVTFKTFYAILEWIYTNEIHSRSTSELLDIWRTAHRFKMRDLHRVVQMKLVEKLREDEKMSEKVSFVNHLKKLFEKAHFQGARYLNRFCSSYLLEHIDLFLNDQLCFPSSSSSSKISKSEFQLKQQYVAWLFMAVDDKFTRNYSHISAEEKNSQNSLGMSVLSSQVPIKEDYSMVENKEEDISQYMSICANDFEDEEEGLEGENSFYSNITSSLSTSLTLSSIGTTGYHLLESAVGALGLVSSSTYNSLSKFLSSSSSSLISDANSNEMKEFDVIRTNWYWKQQNRKLQITPSEVIRVDPSTSAVRSVIKVSNILSIQITSNYYLVLFYQTENQPPQSPPSNHLESNPANSQLQNLWNNYSIPSDHYQTPDATRIAETLREWNPKIRIVSM